MSELISCTAHVAFTRFVSAHGMVHGDPDNKHARKVNIPAHAVAQFVKDGLVKAPKGFEQASEPEAGTVPATDANDADSEEEGAPE